MNDAAAPAISSPENKLISEALDRLKESSGIAGTTIPDADGAGAKVVLTVAGKSLQYDCKVKQRVDRLPILDDMKARSVLSPSTILVCHPLTHAMALRCQELDVQFIDTAGNAYITDGAGVLIKIMGRKIGNASLTDSRGRTIPPTALRMMFAFLADPAMLNAPYRDISASVQVATGAIGKILETFEARGFIGTAPSGKRIILSPALMLSEWSTGYMSRLRPKLKTFRFAGPALSEFRNAWTPALRISAWGGEVAAEILTKHLIPATCTIYFDLNDTSALGEMVKHFRLRADPQGPIEVVETFWNTDYFSESFPTVPLHLVYADLLGTNDSRNLTVAQQISHEVIEHVRDSNR